MVEAKEKEKPVPAVSSELNENAEYRGNREDQEDLLLTAQRYLNIFHQIHIFREAKRAEFDQQLLDMPNKIRQILALLPGGRILLEHISDLETQKGIKDAVLSNLINQKAPAADAVPNPMQAAAVPPTQVVPTVISAPVELGSDFTKALTDSFSTYSQNLQKLNANIQQIAVQQGNSSADKNAPNIDIADTISTLLKENSQQQMDVLKNFGQTLSQTILESQKEFISSLMAQQKDMKPQIIERTIIQKEAPTVAPVAPIAPVAPVIAPAPVAPAPVIAPAPVAPAPVAPAPVEPIAPVAAPSPEVKAEKVAAASESLNREDEDTAKQPHESITDKILKVASNISSNIIKKEKTEQPVKAEAEPDKKEITPEKKPEVKAETVPEKKEVAPEKKPEVKAETAPEKKEVAPEKKPEVKAKAAPEKKEITPEKKPEVKAETAPKNKDKQHAPQTKEPDNKKAEPIKTPAESSAKPANQQATNVAKKDEAKTKHEAKTIDISDIIVDNKGPKEKPLDKKEPKAKSEDKEIDISDIIVDNGGEEEPIDKVVDIDIDALFAAAQDTKNKPETPVQDKKPTPAKAAKPVDDIAAAFGMESKPAQPKAAKPADDIAAAFGMESKPATQTKAAKSVDDIAAAFGMESKPAQPKAAKPADDIAAAFGMESKPATQTKAAKSADDIAAAFGMESKPAQPKAAKPVDDIAAAFGMESKPAQPKAAKPVDDLSAAFATSSKAPAGNPGYDSAMQKIKDAINSTDSVSLDDLDVTPVSLTADNDKGPVSLEAAFGDLEDAFADSNTETATADDEWEYVDENGNPVAASADDEWEYVDENGNPVAASDDDEWEYVDENGNPVTSADGDEWEYVDENGNPIEPSDSDEWEYVDENGNPIAS